MAKELNNKPNGEGKSPSPGTGELEVADLLGRTSFSSASSSSTRKAPAYNASDFAKWEFAITAYLKLRRWWRGITTQSKGSGFASFAINLSSNCLPFVTHCEQQARGCVDKDQYSIALHALS